MQEWLHQAGLVTKAEFDDLHERYRRLSISLGDRYLEAVLGSTESHRGR